MIWEGLRWRFVRVILEEMDIGFLGVKGGAGWGRGLLLGRRVWVGLVKPGNEFLGLGVVEFCWVAWLELLLLASVGMFGSFRKEKKFVACGVSFFSGLNTVVDFWDSGF